MIEKRKPGRPPKVRPVEIVHSEAETPATVVKPVPDPASDPNPVFVDSIADCLSLPEGTLIQLRPDDSLPAVSMSAREIEAAKDVPVLPDNGALVTHEPIPGPRTLSPQQVAVLDHDHDGHAGGSRPVAKLTDLQVRAFTQDAVDAYGGQFEVKRVDAFNRVWAFRHETYQNRDHMLIEVRRGPTVASRMISTAVFSAGHAMVAIEEIDKEAAR